MTPRTATYTVSGLGCRNCGWRQSAPNVPRLEITRGRTVAETPCPNCGCKALTKGLRA